MVFALEYGAARVLEDFLREDVRRFGLTASQWTALATVSICLYTMTVLRRTPRWGRWDELPAAASSVSEEDHGPEP
jgi:hypothetical protein